MSTRSKNEDEKKLNRDTQRRHALIPTALAVHLYITPAKQPLPGGLKQVQAYHIRYEKSSIYPTMIDTIRLIVHSRSGPGYHDVDYHWLREEDITQEILGYLDQIKDGLSIDDGDYEPYVDKDTKKFIENIGTENSLLWSRADLLQNPRVVQVYTITTTEY